MPTSITSSVTSTQRREKPSLPNTDRTFAANLGDALRNVIQHPHPLDARSPTDIVTLEISSDSHSARGRSISDYGLSAAGVAHLLGQVVRYEVGNVFNPAYTMICSVEKKWLPKLT